MTRIDYETRRPENHAGSKTRRWGFAGKMYLPLFVQGLTTTVKHLFSRKVTVQLSRRAAEDRQSADLSRRASAEQGRRRAG